MVLSIIAFSIHTYFKKKLAFQEFLGFSSCLIVVEVLLLRLCEILME